MHIAKFENDDFDPVRKMPRFGAQKNLGKFPSVKTGHVAWYESLLERDYMYLLDFDPGVISWREQPLRIRFIQANKTYRYTPDFEVQRASKMQLVEVKPKDKVGSGKYDIIFRTVAAVCGREGYEYVVATDDFIRLQPRLDNVKKLWKYARTPTTPRHQILCDEFFRVKGVSEVALGGLAERFRAEHIPVQALYALLFWGALDFDLMCPLGPDSIIWLPLTAA